MCLLNGSRIKTVEIGTHKESLAKNGVYNKLWNYQSGGFVRNMAEIDWDKMFLVLL